MCGIAGFLDKGGATPDGALEAMAQSLAHRGPDGQGLHRAGPIGLAHRRLAIIDLSAAADEPMTNEDGTLWLVFNGEIYNFRELRERLAPRHRFRSQGDGETILHLYEEHGDECVAQLDGMFAFALWDAPRQRLLLARDRSGKKPLYYADTPSVFAFGSEPKAVLAHPAVPRALRPESVPLLLAHGYVPAPLTMHEGVRQVPPAHLLTVDARGASEPRRYWRAAFRSGPAVREDEAAGRLLDLLRGAVRRRLVSDVPLGAYLSGGIDSSAVVGLMAEAGGTVRTFCIGFEGAPAYDERAHARAVANHFGTDHTEFVVEPKSIELIDRLVHHHDAPFADSSAVPSLLLAELTRKHVTVSLTGDGGDEVFAGYLRFIAGDLSERVPRAAFRLARAVGRALPQPADRRHPLRFAQRFAEAGALPFAERYFSWIGLFTEDLAEWVAPSLLEHAARDVVLRSYHSPLELAAAQSPLARLLQLNFETYLPDDLLVKADRTSMAVGLELRAPFLDTALVEFGASLPDAQRITFRRGKRLLRRAVKDLLPPSILQRGKAGFGVPLGAWFRGGLAPAVRERLLPRGPLHDFVRPEPVARLVEDHVAGRGDHSARLWTLLTLESFLRQERAR